LPTTNASLFSFGITLIFCNRRDVMAGFLPNEIQAARGSVAAPKVDFRGRVAHERVASTIGDARAAPPSVAALVVSRVLCARVIHHRHAGVSASMMGEPSSITSACRQARIGGPCPLAMVVESLHSSKARHRDGEAAHGSVAHSE
jgi:hypothetical protein